MTLLEWSGGQGICRGVTAAVAICYCGTRRQTFGSEVRGTVLISYIDEA